MAGKTTTAQDDQLLGKTVPADEADSLKGWTAQSETSPPPNAREAPQQFVEEQLPDQEEMDKLGLTIPENQLTDDVAFLDPADQVRVGNADYASPLGITAVPEGTHIPGESTEPEEDRAFPELSVEDGPANAAADDGDLNSKTKAELVDMARDQGVEGYSSMNKDELVAALGG